MIPRGPQTRTIAALGAVCLVFFGVITILGRGGATGSVRTVLGCTALLVVPGWLIGRLVDEDGDAIARLISGMTVTLAVSALFGFLAFELGLRLATVAYAVPLLALIAVLTVLGKAGPAPKAALAPLGLAALLGVAALTGAWVTHLSLPAVPIEPAVSLEAATATASPHGVVVNVSVVHVHSSEPSVLMLSVDDVHSTAVVAPTATTVRLQAALPPHTSSCPTRVEVFASDGAYLSPPVLCVGW